MGDVCTDERFEIIEKAKKHIIDATNIMTSPDEMKVLDTFLYRCWQMGWLDKYKSRDDGAYLESFVHKDGVRYNMKVINMKEVATTLTNSLMDGVHKLYE